jgi:hypothetical protein
MGIMQSSRKKFLQLLGLSAGATMINGSARVVGINQSDIRKLNPGQKEFMTRYEQWMEEYIQVIRIRKTDPDNIENHKTMIALTHKAEAFKPELAEFMQDETFAGIFRITIEKMTREIPA